MDHFGATASAVATIVCSVLVGTAVAPRIPNIAVAVRDLSYITTAVCVPSLLFNKMATSFTGSMLSAESLLLIGFGYATALIGGSLGYLCARCAVDERYAFFVALGTAFQNIVVVPVALLMALRVPWFTPELRDRAIAYVFVFNIAQTTTLWTAGNAMIMRAASRLHGRHAGSTASLGGVLHSVVQALWTGPFIATVTGIACGLAAVGQARGPQQYLVGVLLTASDVLGEPVVPLSLVLLGVNLRSARGSSTSAVAGSSSQFTRLVVLTTGIRLVVMPAVFIALFHFVVRPLLPSVGRNPALVLVLFVEMAAPTAIATSLLCNVHDYMPTAYAQALFCQYLCVVVTSVAWLTFTLTYIDWFVLPEL